MLNIKILSTGKNAVIVEVNCYILYFTASHHVAWHYTFARVKTKQWQGEGTKRPQEDWGCVCTRYKVDRAEECRKFQQIWAET